MSRSKSPRRLVGGEERIPGPPPGQVGFRIELWPHDPPINGQIYESSPGMDAASVATILREHAVFIERYWSKPDRRGRQWPEPTPEQIAEKRARHEEALG